MESIAPPPFWLTVPPLQDLFDVLGTARIVGGSVRDTILGRPVGDLDMATPLLPEQVLQRLNAAGVRCLATGLAHGTITALLATGPVEITTLRRDLETDGRHATVAYTESWAIDASRRDFTLNALYMDRGGLIHDPLGTGLTDCRAGHVRFIGDAASRIAEDILRVLRFYRFQAVYGRIPAEPEARQACRAAIPALPRLSGERVQTELLKLLAGSATGIELLIEDRIWAGLGLPEPTRIERLKRLVGLEPAADPLLRLAALITRDADRTAERLRLSNADRDRLAALLQTELPPADASPLSQREALYRLGPTLYRDLLLLRAAAQDDMSALPGLLNLAEHWPVPKLPVRGADLLDLGVTPGPAIAGLLRDVEAWWIAGDFKADRDACLAHLTERVRAR